MWKFKPTLEYTTGWKVFGELLQFGLILGSIMIICVISGIFAEESQTKMLPLIFTTVEGKRKDTSAKVLASFTITVCYMQELQEVHGDYAKSCMT